MSGIEVVVTDLDGTLWDASEEPHPKASAALKELEKRGVPLLVATGRRRRSARRALRQAGLDFLPAVLLDGAVGCRSLEEEALFQCPFSDSEVKAHTAVFREFGEEPVFETDHFLHDRLSGHSGGDYQHLITDPMTLSCDLTSPLPIPALSVVGIVDRRIAPLLLEALNVLDAGRAWIAFEPDEAPEAVAVRVRPPRCSKWEGICRWLGHHGIGSEAVLAVGDAENDLEMLEAASVSLAMQSGSPAARAAAQHLIPPPSLGGWAAVLDYL